MGRPRMFDTAAVVAAARDAFVRAGYAGASVDDLLRATGLQRASLYSAFGSKRGLLLAAIAARPLEQDVDLLLVVLVEAAEDRELSRLVADPAARTGPVVLGRRLLQRAGLGGLEEEGTRT